MGRNKIKIERITNERTRLATLNKRKNGLVKKAMELAILCNCEVALIVIGNNKLTQYSSSDMDQLLLRYTEGGFEEPHPDPLTNDDYPRLFGKKNKGSSSGGQLSSGSLHSGSGLKESPSKRQRTESPTPGASDSPITQLSDGRTSPTAVPTLVPRGPSPVTTAGGRPVSPTAAAAPAGAAHPATRMAAPPQQPPLMAYAGSYERYLPAGTYQSNGPNRSAVFPPSHQSSPSPSRSSLPSSLYSVPAHPAVPGRLSPSHPHMQRHGSAGSPMLEGARPQSPHSNPTTPPGSGGHFAAAAAAAEADVRSLAAGRMHQEQQFTQKLNKKNLSLAIPDASSSSSSGGASFPGSSSAGQASRHTTYTPGFTALGVPSHMPFLGAPAEHDGMQHSGVLPSPSAFFSGETPGSHPSAEHGPYSAAGLLPHGGWGQQQQQQQQQGGSWLSSSPLPGQRLMALHEQQPSFLPTARFLSRDLNMALEGHCTPTVDGALHQLGLTSKAPAGYAAGVGDKRKACELRKA